MEQVGTEKIGGEQAADLAALMGMVAEEKAAPGVPGEVPTAQDDAAAWAMLPATLGALLCNFMPELESAYSKKNCMEWGAAMVPVAAEYGWNAKDVMGPKMALAVASLPFVVPTYFAIRARRAAPSEPVREERPAVQEAPPAASALDGMSAPGVQPLGNGE